jgi:predicted MPP superfamily phosphohydrolase
MLIAICLLWSLIETQLYRVKRVEIKSKKINSNIKIVFISDIHYGDYYMVSRLRRIIASINKLTPDIIIIGGDYLYNGKKSKFNKKLLEELFSQLSYLKSKNGIFTVIGNHEYNLGMNLDLMLENINASKITLLKNSTYELSIGNEKVLIHGVDDLQEGHIDVQALHMDKECLNILISHNPDFFESCDLDFDIGLSGHTHGGQVNLFGIFAPITESKYGQKYIKTINVMGDSPIITTKGLGCSTLPIRFFALPEIIELKVIGT